MIMASGDDNSWVFDSLICFLNGPVWNAPLQSFIEEKSLIFEPFDKENDEYRKIHDEFKNLVDLMLGSYMEDIGITPEQFETACSNGMHQKLPAKFQENLFEQIWAANDFDMFKRMMIQKNIELQLQALELIEQKYGITPHIFLPGAQQSSEELTKNINDKISDENTSSQVVSLSGSTSTVSPLEKQVLVEVVKQCENEDSLPPLDDDELSKEKSYLQEEKQLLENVLHAAVVNNGKNDKDNNENKNNSNGNSSGSSKENENDIKKLTKSLIDQNQHVDDAEIKKRQDYLKAQRDKLVALKKQVRKKHLEIEIGNGVKGRPQSARAAQIVLKSENNGDNDFGVESETLKIRKTLAQRLRSEVIGNTVNIEHE